MVYSFYLCNLLLSAVELPFPVMLVGTWLLYCKDLTNKYLVYIRLSTHCIGCTWTYSLQYNTWRSRCWYEPKQKKIPTGKSPKSPLFLTRKKSSFWLDARKKISRLPRINYHFWPWICCGLDENSSTNDRLEKLWKSRDPLEETIAWIPADFDVNDCSRSIRCPETTTGKIIFSPPTTQRFGSFDGAFGQKESIFRAP